MTIRNLDSFIGGLWDWGILKGCFGETRIAPTDLDGIVERNGYFLVLEAKRPGVTISYGQGCTLEAMRRNGSFTVIIIWGETNKPEKLRLITRHAETDFDPADIDTLRKLVSRWFAWANSQPKRQAA